MPQPKHLTPLGHRIDFEALITVDSANPNGDPMKKGLPRTDSSGRGVISAVCIRRKLRNALAELGQPILISPPERPGDGPAAIRFLCHTTSYVNLNYPSKTLQPPTVLLYIQAIILTTTDCAFSALPIRMEKE